MKIGGIEKTSLIDWPGKITCIIFTIGCNFRCPYCYNPELVYGKVKEIKEEEIFNFLRTHKKFIDAVVFSGGEPTLQKDILEFCKKVRKIGYNIGIETNGSGPEVLEKLIEKGLVDYVAMDVKTSLKNYEKVMGKKKKEEAKKIKKSVRKSVELVKKAGMEGKIEYEFRITVVPGVMGEEDIKEIGKLIKGAEKIALQQFRNEKCLDKKYERVKPYSKEKLKEFAEILKKYVRKVEIRE